jgi:hypothetical protein
METPTPWGEDLYTADANGTLRQRIRAIQVNYFERLRAEEGWEQRRPLGYPAVYGIQPDREWSHPEVRRVLIATRPEGIFSDYEMAEYAFPFESPQLVGLTEAFFNSPQDIGNFESFRIEHPGFREFFVCTHGHVDICCAKFGIPLYNQARAAYPQVRAWRMTHFGGHRFAPTAWEFPSSYKWAFLDQAATAQVLNQDGDAAELAGKIRGWSGAQGQSQILDREGFKRFGWEWLTFKRHGEILEADTEAKRWRVRLQFESPAGVRGKYEGTVLVGRELTEVGCGPQWGERDYQLPEYVLQGFSES